MNLRELTTRDEVCGKGIMYIGSGIMMVMGLAAATAAISFAFLLGYIWIRGLEL